MQASGASRRATGPLNGVHGVIGERPLQSIKTCAARHLVSGLASLTMLAGFGGVAMAQDKAAAQDSKGPVLKLELNRLEPAGESCRTYLLVDNSRGQALKSLKVDLFAFDNDGIAQKRLAVELGPVQDRKTMVRLFDFPALACPRRGSSRPDRRAEDDQDRCCPEHSREPVQRWHWAAECPGAAGA